MDYSIVQSGRGILQGSSVSDFADNYGISSMSVTTNPGYPVSTVSYPAINTIGHSNFDSIGILNQVTKQNMQAKLAVFTVKRDENGNVTSSTFLDEFWVEKLPNVSVELLAVKRLDLGEAFDPNTLVVREIQTISIY